VKPQKSRDKPPTTGNTRLAQQIRKILGKHYASKYRVRQSRSLCFVFACAKARAGDKASPLTVIAAKPRTLRRFIVVCDFVSIAARPDPAIEATPNKSRA